MLAPYCEGPMDTAIAIVGEAPGEDEQRMNRPFVGAAGKELDRLLGAAGIQRTTCYIDNVVQERPYNNDISTFVDFKKSKVLRTPAFDRYVDGLKLRLSNCKANVIVALGNVPLYALTGLHGITKYRGSILESSLLPGRKIIPTIHPSAVLREYSYNRFVVFDLIRAKQESKSPDLHLPFRMLITDPSYSQVMSYLDECENSTDVAFDIEVTHKHVSHISFANSPYMSMCIPFYDGGRDYFTPDQEASIWIRIEKLLENTNVRKWAHNAVFDVAFLYKRYGIITQNVACSMIAVATLYPDYPHSLAFVTSIYCEGEPYYKDDRSLYEDNPFGSVQQFRIYNAKDSAMCIQAGLKMEQELTRQGNIETFKWKCELVHPLAYMQEHGIRMNVERLRSASARASKNLARYERVLEKLCGRKINYKSPKQLKDYFYGVLGHDPYIKSVKTPAGRKSSVTVDELALTRLARKGVRAAQCLLGMRKLHKAQSTYYDMNLDEDNRLRCSFNPVGTTNDRLSSSKTIFDTGANMQNQPGEIKRLMLADDGYGICNVDLGQAENRVVAFIANEPRMMEAFSQGIDIHKRTAALILGIPETEVTKRDRNEIGKPANHGLNYGLGYKKFALMHQMEESHARFIVEQYHMSYPAIRQWHAIIQAELSRDRTLTNLYGRKRTFVDRWSDELFKSAYDYIPQSTVGTKMNKEGVVFIYQNSSTYFRGWQLLNQVHDSVVIQFPLSLGAQQLADGCMRLKDSLEKPLSYHGRSFSIPADFGFGYNCKDLTELKSRSISTATDMANFIREVFHIQ